MRYQHLVEPVAPDSVCGPDLDDILDNDYLNYIMIAEGKLPSAYFDKDRNPVSRQSIDFAKDIAPAAVLLDRSRDLRLLSLEARLRAITGDIAGFCECVVAAASLLEDRWDDVHPGANGNLLERQAALNGFNSRTTVSFPLIFAPLVRDKQLGELSLRSYMLATGAATAQGSETNQKPIDEGQLLRAVSSVDNAAGIEAVHTSLKGALGSFARLYDTMVEKAGYDLAPDFETVRETINEIVNLIETARRDLSPQARTDGEAAFVGGTSSDPGTAGPQSGPVPIQTAVPLGQIKTHRDAMAALAAAERYFSSMEPSAPALVLIRQARLLVGRPLVDALVALIPEKAEKMAILLDSNRSFLIGMDRLRELSNVDVDTGESADETAGTDLGSPLPQGAKASTASFSTIETRGDAFALLTDVEAFFQNVEPSSPIPILIRKSKTYTNRDFNFILRDLLELDGSGN